jgi:adenylate kinase
MKLVILGPQGAGKGTQAEKIAIEYKLKIVPLGQILRQNVKDRTKLGKIAAHYINKGELIPDELADDLAEHEVQGVNDFIFDAYPRDLEEAEFVYEHFKLDAVIVLQIPNQESIDRISSRRVCSNCGEPYNLITLPSKKPGVCDKCGGALVQREDDQPDAIKTRLEIYHKTTEQVIKFFKEKGVSMVYINADQPIESVWNEIKSKLSKITPE